MSYNNTTKKKKPKKRVRIDESLNTERTLSVETKDSNRKDSKRLKQQIWETRNNIANDDEQIEYGMDEIRHRLTKEERKEHARKMLDKVKQNTKPESISRCTISGGKSKKNKKTRKRRKHIINK